MREALSFGRQAVVLKSDAAPLRDRLSGKAESFLRPTTGGRAGGDSLSRESMQKDRKGSVIRKRCDREPRHRRALLFWRRRARRGRVRPLECTCSRRLRRGGALHPYSPSGSNRVGTVAESWTARDRRRPGERVVVRPEDAQVWNAGENGRFRDRVRPALQSSRLLRRCSRSQRRKTHKRA